MKKPETVRERGYPPTWDSVLELDAISFDGDDPILDAIIIRGGDDAPVAVLTQEAREKAADAFDAAVRQGREAYVVVPVSWVKFGRQDEAMATRVPRVLVGIDAVAAALLGNVRWAKAGATPIVMQMRNGDVHALLAVEPTDAERTAILDEEERCGTGR